MAQPRDVHPIVRTYLTKTTSPSKKKKKAKIHARVYAPNYDLDRRGTGSSPAAAVARALRNVERRR